MQLLQLSFYRLVLAEFLYGRRKLWIFYIHVLVTGLVFHNIAYFQQSNILKCCPLYTEFSVSERENLFSCKSFPPPQKGFGLF